MKNISLLLAFVALYLFAIAAQAQTLPEGPKVVVVGNLVNTGKMNTSIPIDLQLKNGAPSKIDNGAGGDMVVNGVNISGGTTLNNVGTLTVHSAPIYAATITLPSSQSFNSVGNKAALIPTVLPVTTTNKAVGSWTSTNPTVATIDANTGVITVIASGTTNIACKSKDALNRASNTCVVTVNLPLATGVSISSSIANLTSVGAKATYIASVEPAAANQAITWSSSNTTVATVSSTGVVTAVGPNGTATITAAATTDLTKSATKEVKVDITWSCGRGFPVGSNEYPTATFGAAGCWMTQNLRETNGLSSNSNAGSNVVLKYYATPNNGGSGYTTDMGLLYTWAAATSETTVTTNTATTTYQGICPAGWHIPSDNEWTALTTVIGNNVTGTFAAKLVGSVFSGAVNDFGKNTLYWSSNSYDANVAWSRYFASGDTGMSRIYSNKAFFFSVRCKHD